MGRVSKWLWQKGNQKRDVVRLRVGHDKGGKQESSWSRLGLNLNSVSRGWIGTELRFVIRARRRKRVYKVVELGVCQFATSKAEVRESLVL
jgi:hypothetical protein